MSGLLTEPKETIMLCDFTRLSSSRIICTNCGRQTNHSDSSKFFPVATCRIPETYDYSKYRDGKKKKEMGDFLSEIIQTLGYSYDTVSSERTRITYLNKKGLLWAQKHQDIIVQWIIEECPKRNITPLPKLFAAIVRLAIRRAKKANKFLVSL